MLSPAHWHGRVARFNPRPREGAIWRNAREIKLDAFQSAPP